MCVRAPRTGSPPLLLLTPGRVLHPPSDCAGKGLLSHFHSSPRHLTHPFSSQTLAHSLTLPLSLHTGRQLVLLLFDLHFPRSLCPVISTPKPRLEGPFFAALTLPLCWVCPPKKIQGRPLAPPTPAFGCFCWPSLVSLSKQKLGSAGPRPISQSPSLVYPKQRRRAFWLLRIDARVAASLSLNSAGLLSLRFLFFRCTAHSWRYRCASHPLLLPSPEKPIPPAVITGIFPTERNLVSGLPNSHNKPSRESPSTVISSFDGPFLCPTVLLLQSSSICRRLALLDVAWLFA